MARVDKGAEGAQRAFNHRDMNVSHDIVMYDYYLQPLSSGTYKIQDSSHYKSLDSH